MAVASYNPTMITKLIAEALEREGYGSQSRLARACHVKVQTVSKWKDGQIVPLPERWPVIEDFFGMDPGTLGRESKYTGAVPAGYGTSAAAGPAEGETVYDYNSKIASLTPEAQAYIDSIIEREERKQRE